MKRSRRGEEVLYLGLTAMIALLFYVLYASPLFRVEQIHLQGMEYNQPEPLLEMLETQKGKRLLEINPLLLEKEIKAKIPEVKKIKILRQLFPGRLDVFVAERTPWLYWKEGGFWVDGEGIALNRLKNPNMPQSPILFCSPEKKADGGVSLSFQTQTILKRLNPVIQGPKETLLQAVIIDNEAHSSLRYGDLLFRLGNDQGLDKKVATLYSLLGIAAKYPLDEIEYINISVPEKPAIKYRSPR